MIFEHYPKTSFFGGLSILAGLGLFALAFPGAIPFWDYLAVGVLGSVAAGAGLGALVAAAEQADARDLTHRPESQARSEPAAELSSPSAFRSWTLGNKFVARLEAERMQSDDLIDLQR